MLERLGHGRLVHVELEDGWDCGSKMSMIRSLGGWNWDSHTVVIILKTFIYHVVHQLVDFHAVPAIRQLLLAVNEVLIGGRAWLHDGNDGTDVKVNRRAQTERVERE